MLRSTTLRLFRADSFLSPSTLPCAALLAAGAFAVPQNPIERVSVASGGTQADGPSYYATLSGDGRYVAFSSDATNLVPGDTNGVDDVFRHDRLHGTTIRVSVGSTGAEGDDESYTSYLDAISDDGRYVVFTSDAGNLVPGDTNGGDDVFVRDVRLGTTIRVSVGPGGVEANADSYDASISDDGSRVVFTSGATNLVSPPTDGNPQVYVHDLSTGTTSIASVSSSGAVGDGVNHYAAISGDGLTVAFVSTSHNLVSGIDPATIPNLLYVHDLPSGTTTLETMSPALATGAHFAGYQSLSRDGRYVAFWSDAPDLVPGDANGEADAFQLDRSTGEIRLVSVSSTGTQGNALIAIPRMSADGRFVAFTSDLGTLVPGDTNGRFDTFVHDRVTGATNRVSVGVNGEQGTSSVPWTTAFPSGLSADGRFVAFASDFRNLVAGDSNGVADVFVVDRASPVPASYCEAKVDSQGCEPAITSSGTPTPSGSAPFDVRAEPVRSQRIGVLMYGLGPNQTTFGSGLLCTAPPLERTAIVSSGGSAGCTGSLSIDFNERIRSGVDPALVPGTVVYAQYLYRDGQSLDGTGLGASDALRFAIQP